MDNIIPIKEAAKMLGVTLTTLRRWDKAGKLKAIRAGETGHRYYKESDIHLFMDDLETMAQNWAGNATSEEPAPDYYCSNSSIFQARLTRMDDFFSTIEDLNGIYSLLVAITGEIGNNSFDHNLGNWPDVPGIFFAYDLSKKIIVLADRGIGIWTSLKRVRPNLASHQEALKVAFTEIITGRAPESRGNGLKFVRKVVSAYPISLRFQTGDSGIVMEKLNADLNFTKPKKFLRGCFALIQF